jgi:hypothetical protein
LRSDSWSLWNALARLTRSYPRGSWIFRSQPESLRWAKPIEYT